VSGATVRSEAQPEVHIGKGVVVLLGIATDDTEADAEALAGKVANLRLFEDAEGRLNLSVRDIGGDVLAVSNFTLLGDARKGRRPSFTNAASGEVAEPLYERFAQSVREEGVEVAMGFFGARMEVDLCNDGPVTLLLDSRKQF